MEINYLAVLVCGVAAMIIGFIWYGPIFGKKWLQIVGATEMDMERRKEMQKKAMPLYALQFLFSLMQAYMISFVLAEAFARTPQAEPVMLGATTAFFLWLGWAVPLVAAGSMWNNDTRPVAWARFLIQAGYYLVVFVLFGIIISVWK